MFIPTFTTLKLKIVITQYSNLSPSIDLSKHLVVKGYGKSYPRNPTTGYVSTFPDSVFGCLGIDLICIFFEIKNHRVSVVRNVY